MIRMEQFAAMNMIYNRHSFSFFLDSLERLEIENLELWTGAPHLNNFISSLSDAGKVRREIEKRGKRIVCVTPEQVMYPHNIAAGNKELREWSLKYFLSYIEMTAELGADKMLCCSGWGDYDEDREEAWKRSVESLWKMTEKARSCGIVLAFEILCPFESNLVNDLASTKRMMEEIQEDCFRLCVDTVPVRLGGNTLDEFFDIFGKRICHVHLTDGTPTGHVPCGTGDHDVKAHIDALNRNEYQGAVTLEIGDTSWSVEPELATKIGFDTVRKILC